MTEVTPEEEDDRTASDRPRVELTSAAAAAAEPSDWIKTLMELMAVEEQTTAHGGTKSHDAK